MKVAIITGSGGLIGSQSATFLINKGYKVIGIDNDMRAYFFGTKSSTLKNQESLSKLPNFQSENADIRDYDKIEKIFKNIISEGCEIDLVVHTAAQPSHDWAAKEPITDFTINALGTMNLLEISRTHAPRASFIFTSTNKVYGDLPNFLNIKERESRYEAYSDPEQIKPLIGIDESMSIDNSQHSIFGASKVAADVMVQEYGKYFGMNTVVFRGGCLTGPEHTGAELHGFLSYLIKCIVRNNHYTIYGYKAKQVRDNIHSADLVNMFWAYHQNPRPGEVYNAGGGRGNSISILESISLINEIIHKLDGKAGWSDFSILDEARRGDHIWYITDLTKFQSHYPEWKIARSIMDILKEMTVAELKKT